MKRSTDLYVDGKRHILVADDEMINRELLNNILCDEYDVLMAEDVLINAEIMEQIIMVRGAEIDHAENGKIVLDMFEKSKEGYYDAILMDVRMPEMDGLAATEAIRALGRPDAKKIPIIAMTANAFDEDVQRSLQVGMNAHLSKPVEPDRLYQTLEELIWEYDQAKNN